MKSLYLHIYLLSEDFKRMEIILLMAFFFIFQLASCDILSSYHFIHIQREATSTFSIIPEFTPFSPSIINLFHHLAGELVFPLRWHVILPTHNIKQCPCTTITLRLCPLPASQRFSSLQIKELCCPASFSSSSFPS